jgi:hypothetical protein
MKEQMREALERIAKYPMTRSEEMSIETARDIARAALSAVPASQCKETGGDCGGEDAIRFFGLVEPLPQDPAKNLEQTQFRNIRKVVKALADFCFGNPRDPVYGAYHTALTASLTARDGLDISSVGLEPLSSESQQPAQEPVKQESWMPIETAPKDGSEVLLMVKSRAGIKKGFLVGHYMGGGHCIEDHPPIDSGWYFWNGRMFDKESEPTHWMPLPLPPVEVKE